MRGARNNMAGCAACASSGSASTHEGRGMTFDNRARMVRNACAVGLICVAAAVTSDGVVLSAAGHEFFVAPDGLSTNNGSLQRPLDLTTALSSASPARPGDVIWLRGGTYQGAFRSALVGTPSLPIIVRQYPGERATIDSATTTTDALTVAGAHTWFWGFEIASSDPGRSTAQTGSWPSDLHRGYGAVTHAPGIKFINLIVHDNANGLGIWLGADGSEAYGNIIYYNGWQAPDRAHGHGIYTQNQAPTRRITDNIIFDQFSHGIHAYGSDAAWLDNISLEGNVSFMNGALSVAGVYGSGRDILLGGGRVAANAVVDGNFTYKGQTNLGYGAGCSNGRIANNYFAGPLVLVRCDALTSGNSLYDESWPRYGTWPTQFPGNTFYAQAPTQTVVRVRPNVYERGRSHVVIYNWGQLRDVAVNLSGTGLATGAAYEIRDAQNFFDGVVASGIYNGGVVNVPLTGLTAVLPVGNVPRVVVHTAPGMAVFVVVPLDGSITPPTGSPTPPPTIDLSLSAASISAGQSATLSWSSSNASVVSISPGISSAPNGVAPVSPRVTTTYVATATNSAGDSVSDSVTLTVNPATVAPTLRIDSPAPGATFPDSAPIVIDASAVDPSSSIRTIRFFANGTPLGEDTTSPYRAQWTGARAGQYVLTAQGLGISDAVVASAPPVTILVETAAPQSVPAPTITPGVTFSVSMAVTVRSAAADAVVRFTTDGSAPVATSPIYRSPIVLTRTTVVQARAFIAGRASAITTASFTLRDTVRPSVFSATVQVVSPTSATITWSTNEPADSGLEFFWHCPGACTVGTSALVTAHSLTVTGLQPTATYTAQIRSRDAAGNLGTSNYLTIRTPR